jgi:hypothetical protein
MQLDEETEGLMEYIAKKDTLTHKETILVEVTKCSDMMSILKNLSLNINVLL